MRVTVGPVGSMDGFTFVVALSRMEGRLLLSRHRLRDTWETQGGHIEPGETPLEAMRRELYEESGAIRYTLAPLCDYEVENRSGAPGVAAGRVYVAELDELGPLPPSEIAETRAFDALLAELSYPSITPLLFREARRQGFFANLWSEV